MFRNLQPAASKVARSSSCAPAAASGIGRSSSITSAAAPPGNARSLASTPAPTKLVRSSSITAAAGAVDEKEFYDAFMVTRAEQFTDVNALLDRLTGINTFLTDSNNDWSKKVKMLGNLRGCLISNIPHCLDIILENAGLWKKCLNDGLKELRSSLTREYCITIAYFTVKYRARFMPLVELMLPNMMNLVKNSAKIISSSAAILLQFIAKFVDHVSLIPTLEKHMASKAAPVRTHTVKMIAAILSNWKSTMLIPQISIIHQVIKSGLTDANGDCRVAAKEAFYVFYAKFANEALKLHDSLDSSRQRALKVL